MARLTPATKPPWRRLSRNTAQFGPSTSAVDAEQPDHGIAGCCAARCVACNLPVPSPR